MYDNIDKGEIMSEDIQSEAVQEVAETHSEQAIDMTGVKINKPKAMPVTDESGVIGSPDTKREGTKKVGAIGTVKNGVIGSGKVDKQDKKSAEKKSAAKPETNKVAVHSTRNVDWPGVGKVSKGYNIVTPDQAEKWSTRSHIRIATPEEVAGEFGL
jgi:hypothetical protein